MIILYVKQTVIRPLYCSWFYIRWGGGGGGSVSRQSIEMGAFIPVNACNISLQTDYFPGVISYYYYLIRPIGPGYNPKFKIIEGGGAAGGGGGVGGFKKRITVTRWFNVSPT